MNVLFVNALFALTLGRCGGGERVVGGGGGGGTY